MFLSNRDAWTRVIVTICTRTVQFPGNLLIHSVRRDTTNVDSTNHLSPKHGLLLHITDAIWPNYLILFRQNAPRKLESRVNTVL